MCGASSVEQPTGDISRAPRAGWIIVTASGPIDAGSCCAAWSNLPASISLRKLVAIAKLRWRIERDYEELK